GGVVVSRVRGRPRGPHHMSDDATRRVVGIDGASGAGKSTVGRAVGTLLGLPVLDTGAMYRAVALAVLEADVDPGHEAACLGIAQSVMIENEGTMTKLDGRDVSSDIRGPAVTAVVSAVSAPPSARRGRGGAQGRWAQTHASGAGAR